MGFKKIKERVGWWLVGRQPIHDFQNPELTIDVHFDGGELGELVFNVDTTCTYLPNNHIKVDVVITRVK